MLRLQQVVVKPLMAVACLSIMPAVSQAAISLDRTRVIFNGADKSMTLNISNDNKQLPYLAQAWLEDAEQKKIDIGPLVITPPIQRMEPGTKSLIRISSTSELEKLPKDRETLFYFNLREIPPKSEKANVLQIALQTKVKLFYRPEKIKAQPNDIWQNKLIFNKVHGGYSVENPTPYFVTIIGLGSNEKEAKEGRFDAIMLSPKSTENIKSENRAALWITYINDYGGRIAVEYKCTGNRCTAFTK